MFITLGFAAISATFFVLGRVYERSIWTPCGFCDDLGFFCDGSCGSYRRQMIKLDNEAHG